jgi:hypothetical protein
MSRMNFQKLETLGDVLRIEIGRIMLRARNGHKLPLTGYARTVRLPDGSFILEPLGDRVSTAQAVEILDIPYTTLKRIIDAKKIKAFKRSAGRWGVDLASLMEYKTKCETDSEFWEN